MRALLFIILLTLGTIAALYLNAWYLIVIIALLCGMFSEWKVLWTGLAGFFIVLLVWSALIWLRDGSFHHSPTSILSPLFGDVPPTLIPLIGGIIGGLVALFASMAGAAFFRVKKTRRSSY